MNKTLGLLLAVLLVAAAFVGCESANTPADDLGETIPSATEETNAPDNTLDDQETVGGEETTEETTQVEETTEAESTEETSQPQEEVNASQGLEFRVEAGYAMLIGRGTCEDEDIVIPSYYMDVPVTTIGQTAFMNDNKLKSITIPETVTTIEDFAIRGCAYLQTIRIPASVVNFGAGLFWGCNSLPFVVYNEVIYFGTDENPYMVLYTRSNPQIVSHEVHPDTKYICGLGFEGVKTLESITLPEGLLAIDKSAFSACSALAEIRIPESVNAIHGSAFNECTNLSTVTLGKGLAKLGEHAFYRTDAAFYFTGTEAEWAVIADSVNWAKNSGTGSLIICTDTVTE